MLSRDNITLGHDLQSRDKTLNMSIPKIEDRLKADKLRKITLRKLCKDGRQGEADRTIYNWKPRHLNSGKRKLGKVDFR